MKRNLSSFAFSLLFGTSCLKGAELDSTEIFKRLLSSPPIITEMIYLDKVPQQTHHQTPRETGFIDSTDYTKYFLTWQPSAMSFHSAPKVSATNASSFYDEFFLALGNDFHFLNGRQFAFHYKLQSAGVKPRAFPPAYHAALIKQHAACEPMNLGINHLMPGSVAWEGENFSAAGSADQKPMFISGRISGLSNRVPTEIHVQYSNDMGIANYRIAYEYSYYRPPYYPTRIATYFQHDRSETEYRDYRILSVSTTNAPLSRKFFDPSSYINANQMPLSAHAKINSGLSSEEGCNSIGAKSDA